MDDRIERLESIYENLNQSLRDNDSPILILSPLDEDDIEFLRENIGLICTAYRSGKQWGSLLLTYLVIDYVYENYGQSDDEGINLWPSVIGYLKPYICLDRSQLVKIIIGVIESYGLTQIDEGKQYLNTVLLHSSSKYYSPRFFGFISSQYEKMEHETRYDLESIALRISNDFEENSSKVTQMSHSFGLLIKEQSLFPSIFRRVIEKIDQKVNNQVEFDLGRWEQAFNEWYLDSNNASYTRKKAEVFLENNDGDYYLKIVIPTSIGVPKNAYSIQLNFSGTIEKIDVNVVSRGGVTKSYVRPIIYQIHAKNIFGRIAIVDSTGVSLLDMPASNHRFFTLSGKYVNNPPYGDSRVLIKGGTDYNIPEFYSDKLTERISLIQTKLDRDTEYTIGDEKLLLESKISRSSVCIVFPESKGPVIECDDVPYVIPEHPIIQLDQNVESLRVSLKDFSGRYIFNDIIVPDENQIRIDSLTEETTGIYRLTVSFEGYRLVAVKYLLVEGLEYESDRKLCMRQAGVIRYSTANGSELLHYDETDRYSEELFSVNGKNFICRFRTPNLFFNPSPEVDDNHWIPAGIEGFDSNEIGNSIGISVGCLSEGKVDLIVRSSLESEVIPGQIADGISFFDLHGHIRVLQESKRAFSLELRYNGQLFPLFSIGTKGKYDVGIMNDLVIITPYKLPKGCFARYEYHTFSEHRSGFLKLCNTEVFDIGIPCFLRVSEVNMDTNDEIIIYEKSSHGLKRPNYASRLDGLSEYDRALHLLTGCGCEMDYAEAIRLLNKLSSEGNSNATLELAKIYMNGFVTEMNLDKASDYFTIYLNQINTKSEADN